MLNIFWNFFKSLIKKIVCILIQIRIDDKKIMDPTPPDPNPQHFFLSCLGFLGSSVFCPF